MGLHQLTEYFYTKYIFEYTSSLRNFQTRLQCLDIVNTFHFKVNDLPSLLKIVFSDNYQCVQ